MTYIHIYVYIFVCICSFEYYFSIERIVTWDNMNKDVRQSKWNELHIES